MKLNVQPKCLIALMYFTNYGQLAIFCSCNVLCDGYLSVIKYEKKDVSGNLIGSRDKSTLRSYFHELKKKPRPKADYFRNLFFRLINNVFGLPFTYKIPL